MFGKFLFWQCIPDRIVNWTIGIHFLIWTAIRFIDNWQNGQLNANIITVTLLNFSIACFFCMRRPVVIRGGIKSIFLSLPSLLLGAFLFRLASANVVWHWPGQCLFIFGLLLSGVSFAYLRDNFSIFPSVRGVTSAGPYRFIRHPAFLGELITAIALVSVLPKPGLLLFLFFIPALILRILEEEKLLTQNKVYQAYQNQVKWKLFYGLW